MAGKDDSQTLRDVDKTPSHRAQADGPEAAPISVVVCTYNRAPMLKDMLESFLRQRSLDRLLREVVVVDNNSTDGTRAVVAEFQQRCARLRYVFEPRQGLSVARNRGTAETTGQAVAFLDDDILVDPGWLEGMSDCYLQTRADVVGGRCSLELRGPVPPWFGPVFRKDVSEVELGDRRLPIRRANLIFGQNLLVRRDVLEAHGGFCEELGRQGRALGCGEDTQLVAAVLARGGTVLYEPAALGGHVVGPDRLTWDYFWEISRSRAASRAVFFRRQRPLVKLKLLVWGLWRFGAALGLRILTACPLASQYHKRFARWLFFGARTYLRECFTRPTAQPSAGSTRSSQP